MGKGTPNLPTMRRDESTQEERTEYARKALSKVECNEVTVGKNKVTGSIKKVAATGYFSQDNVKSFQTVVATHMLSPELKAKKGRGGFFATVEDLQKEFVDFIGLCQEMEAPPTIAALACYLGCDRQTIYTHANNPNSPFQNDCKNMINYCHMCLENGATENKLNSVAYIFQAKNYYGMKDTQEVQLSAKNSDDVNNEQTLGALKEQIESEKKEEKKYADKNVKDARVIAKLLEEPGKK